MMTSSPHLGYHCNQSMKKKTARKITPRLQELLEGLLQLVLFGQTIELLLISNPSQQKLSHFVMTKEKRTLLQRIE